MSDPQVSKVTKAIVQGPPNAAAAVTKVVKYVIVDTNRSDVATPVRKRIHGHIRYGDGG